MSGIDIVRYVEAGQLFVKLTLAIRRYYNGIAGCCVSTLGLSRVLKLILGAGLEKQLGHVQLKKARASLRVGWPSARGGGARKLVNACELCSFLNFSLQMLRISCQICIKPLQNLASFHQSL